MLVEAQQAEEREWMEKRGKGEMKKELKEILKVVVTILLLCWCEL